MNIIDKVIGYMNPNSGLRREKARMQTQVIREIVNTGYSEGGASTTKKSLKGFRGSSSNTINDIDMNLDILRQRSRNLVMTAPLATSAIKTNRTNVIGSGLKLKSNIDYKTLGITKEQADEWEIKTEKEFELWAESKWCDSLRLNNFYELQQLALMSWLTNGDVFTVLRNLETKHYRPYGLTIHLIEADRISTPSNNNISFNKVEGKSKKGNKIISGVEIDKNGAVIAYHICNQYPQTFNNEKREWVRVEAYGKKTGNPNVLQIMESERCEQYRGVPYLAPVIETLKQITRYTEAELTAAVITAFFTAFIKQTNGNNEMPFSGSVPDEEQIETDENSYELGAGTINLLGPNEDVVIADPKRPSSGFEPFVNAMSKYIGAALEIPYDLLTKSFMKSYSASRAALLEAWKSFRMRRSWFSNDFNQPIYVVWLSEAIARGRINAPGFFNDPAIKKAWCGAEWIGPAQGQLDPVREVNASILRVNNGFSTREKETTELTGGNFDDNIAQIKREKELLNQDDNQEGDNNIGQE